jgi:hypothetical protein
MSSHPSLPKLKLIAVRCVRSPRATQSFRKVALSRSTLARLPALGALLRSREWRGLVRYAGSRNAEPVMWVRSILCHAGSGPSDPETLLHADTFHPTVKAWLFLTDVAEDAGPFAYVPGSRRLTGSASPGNDG